MEIIIAALVDSIIAIIIEDLSKQGGLSRIREKLSGEAPERLALRKCLAAAYLTFSKKYPDLASSFFDKTYLEKPAVAIELAKFLTPHGSPNKSILARLWEEQFFPRPSIDLDIPLSDFLNALQDQINGQAILKPFVDSRAFYQLYILVDRVEDQLAMQSEQIGVLKEIRELIEKAQLEQTLSVPFINKEPTKDSIVILPDVDTSYFTSREKELEQINHILDNNPVVGVWGSPGVGKSTLARYYAEQNKHKYPDGVIGLDTRDKDIWRLAQDFATLIGEPVDPESKWDPSVVMQSRFSRKQALIILDNRNQDSLRKLIPGGRCKVLITTRDRELLNQIGISDEAQIRVHSFRQSDSLLFLNQLIGKERVEQEYEAVKGLVNLVAGLPLALRIAGATLKNQQFLPNSVVNYVAGLLDERKQLSQLKLRDSDELNVLAVFKLSLNLLTKEEVIFFASLAACSKSGFDLKAASATAEFEGRIATQYISRVTNLALLNFDSENNRFKFHPLLYLFARHEAEDRGILDGAEERHAEYFSNYVYQRQGINSKTLHELVVDQDAILQTAKWKIEHGELDITFWFGIRYLLEQRGNWRAGMEVMNSYLELARMQGANSTVAHFHLQLGKFAIFLGDIEKGTYHFEQSLIIEKDLNDLSGIAMALNSLGNAALEKGLLEEAIDYFEQSLQIRESLEDRRGKAVVLNSLGGAFLAAERIDEAIDCFQQSEKIFREISDKRGTAKILNSLGRALVSKGEIDLAIGCFQESLSILDIIGDRRGKAMVLDSLGRAQLAKGNYEDAIKALSASLNIGEELNDLNGTAKVLSSLGKTLAEREQYKEAISCYRRSLEIAQLTDNQVAAAKIWNNIGQAYHHSKQFESAINAYERSLGIFVTRNNWRAVATVYNLIGDSLLAMEDYENAIVVYENSLDIWNDYGDRKRIGNLKRKIRRAESWKNSLKKFSDHGDELSLTTIDHRRIAHVMQKDKNYQHALDHFVLALKLNKEASQLGRLYAEAGDAAFHLEDYEMARKFLSSAISCGEDTTFTNSTLGRVLFKLNASIDEIRPYFERAIELDPNNAWAHSWYSTVLKENGDLMRAEFHARKSVDLNPDNYIFLNNLGLLLFEYNDKPHVTEAFITLKKAKACSQRSIEWLEENIRKVAQYLDEVDSKE